MIKTLTEAFLSGVVGALIFSRILRLISKHEETTEPYRDAGMNE
jgi:hypothetical protein